SVRYVYLLLLLLTSQSSTYYVGLNGIIIVWFEWQSQWSVVWSTTNISEMDNATNRNIQNRLLGRRRLRLGSLAFSAMMTMHCQTPASALTNGIFLSIVLFIGAVLCLANPLRHFEVYVGQWSISGPGRAFRILPLFDGKWCYLFIFEISNTLELLIVSILLESVLLIPLGSTGIGIAMCINAIVRAIICCTMAAIAAIYVMHSVADSKLPHTYCRDFNLMPYDPVYKNLKIYSLRGPKSRLPAEENNNQTVGLSHKTQKNGTYVRSKYRYETIIAFCNETYIGQYPPIYNTPAYNFFYVELVQYRPLTWENVKPWFLIVPIVWTTVLTVYVAANMSWTKVLRRSSRIDTTEILAAVADALKVSLYTHSLGVGTELIHGKALNHYANGHIDPDLHNENVWHSAIVVMLMGLHSSGAAMCANIDYMQLNPTSTVTEGITWILPMYSKCTSVGNYSHIVFREQLVVAALILSCMLLSMTYATNGGIALLESVNAVMTGIGTPFVILLELISLLYVYRSHDFQSDMNVATEENACSSRIGIQWQTVPFIAVV
ncbi:hypothetical protein HF086_001332, partial [Spodoptera exigua]